MKLEQVDADFCRAKLVHFLPLLPTHTVSIFPLSFSLFGGGLHRSVAVWERGGGGKRRRKSRIRRKIGRFPFLPPFQLCLTTPPVIPSMAEDEEREKKKGDDNCGGKGKKGVASLFPRLWEKDVCLQK